MDIINRKKRKSKRGKKNKSRVKPSQNIKAYVKREISRNAETKEVSFYTYGASVLNADSPAFVSSIIPVSPYTGFLDIGQGTGEGNRIGNRIKIKRLTMKGVLFPLPYNSSTNPTPLPSHVVLWFFMKRVESTELPTTLGGFLEEGNTSRNLQNQLSDLISRVNNDRYRYFFRKIFKIGTSGYGGTGSQVAYQYFENNDFKLNQRFSIDLTPYVVKNVIYDDNTTNTPRTRVLCCLMQAIAADGSSMASNIVPCECAYELNCQYEDA